MPGFRSWKFITANCELKLIISELANCSDQRLGMFWRFKLALGIQNAGFRVQEFRFWVLVFGNWSLEFLWLGD